MREAYLDHSATTPVCAEAAQKVLQLMTDVYGNPSSLHTKGLEAQHALEDARAALAASLRCRTDELTFTSGATEANNLALFGAAYARRRRGNRIVISATAHSSVTACADQLEKEGFEVVRVLPDEYGRIPADAFAQAITPNTIVTSMELVNNETGAIQPVQCMARAVKKANAPALVHVDAVQAFGKIAVQPQKLGAQLLSVTAHKIRGPKGVGALYVTHGTHLLPRVFGGEQERKLRPGTEALPLIAGFGAAVRALPPLTESMAHAEALRTELLTQLAEFGDQITVNSAPDALPYVVNFSVTGIRSETILHHLAARGVYVSSGSACARGHKSHVLTAMQLPPERIDSAVRVSFGHASNEEDIEQLIAALKEGLATLTHRR